MNQFEIHELVNRPGLYRTQGVREDEIPDYLAVVPRQDRGFSHVWISPFDGSTEEALLVLYRGIVFVAI